MGLGLKNGGGTCPPNLTSVEKDIYLGECWGIRPIEAEEGLVELKPAASGDCLRMENRNGGEFIYVEYRDGKGWDTLLKKEVIVYHIDRSDAMVGPVSAETRWRHGAMLNAFAGHPCYYRIKGSNPLTPLDWHGEPFGYSIDIEGAVLGSSARVRIM